MADLSYGELRTKLAAECRARRWRLPSRLRLQKLRNVNQLPPLIRVYEKGRRGCSWRYPSSTVAAYIRTEELRRASGKRVRSWKLVEQQETAQAVLAWIRHAGPVPRESLLKLLQACPDRLRKTNLGAALFGYIETPLGDADSNERLKRHISTIESTLDAADLDKTFHDLADCFLTLVTTRDETGLPDNRSLFELLAPYREVIGPFWTIGPGLLNGLSRVLQDAPINELFTSPSTVLDRLTDAELNDAAHAVSQFVKALERLARVEKMLTTLVDSQYEDVRWRWCIPIVGVASWMEKSLLRDPLSSAYVIAGMSAATACMAKPNPKGLDGLRMVAAILESVAASIERNTSTPRLQSAAGTHGDKRK